MMLGVGHPPHQKSKGGRHPRQSSQAYQAVFDAKQVQVLHEAFNFIDQDRDGYITREDLKKYFDSLGRMVDERRVEQMLGLRPGGGTATSSEIKSGINFTTFVTLFSEKLSEFDTESTLLQTFSCFDEDDSGFIEVSQLKELLAEGQNGLSAAEMKGMLSPPFVDNKGRFNYREFCSTLRVTDIEG